MRGVLLAGVSVLIVAATAAMAEDPPPDVNVIDDSAIVTGYAAAMSRNLDVRRAFGTVVDASYFMDIAQFPDRRLATSLSRLPGAGSEPDTGFASVRGLPWIASLSDKRERPRLATAFYDSNRATALDPGTAMNSIMVAKTSDARSTEGGIGGTVDLRTMRPFDFGWHFAAVQAAGGAGDPGGTSWSASGVISDRRNTRVGEIGGLLSLDWTKDRAEIDATSPTAAARFNTREERFGLHSALEWQPNDRLHLLWTGASLRSDPAETRRGAIWSLTAKTHLRDDSTGFEIQYEPAEHWSFTAAGDFGETHAVRNELKIDAGNPAATHEDDLAQLWTYRFDGIYWHDGDTRFDFGFRGTAGATSFSDGTKIRQETYAAYAQVEWNKTWDDVQLRGDAGIRVAQTATRVGTFRSNDTTVLPSLNVSAEILDGLQLRFAVSQSMARPDTAALRNGNPALAPMRSDNFDAGIEYYFAPQSGVTLAAFHKDMHDILAPDGTMRVVNNGSAGFDGLELSFSWLSFQLPFPLDHMETSFNYTFIEAAALNRKLVLPGLARHTINLAETFEHDAIQARIAYRWQSGTAARAVWPITGPTGFSDGGGTLDADLYYTLFDDYRIGVEAEDLFGDTRTIDTAAAVHYARFETGRRILLSLHANVW